MPANRLMMKARVKILTDTHFAFGQQVDDSDEVTAGGGRYTLEGNTYTEIIEYHTSVPVGIRIPFECRIEGDTWYHTGYIGSGQYQLKLEEVWRRLK